MSDARKKILSVILVMGLAFASSSSCKRHKEEKIRTEAGLKPSMTVVLKYTPGAANGPSLLTLRLMGAAKKGEASALRQKRAGQDAGQPQEIPVMDVAPDFWTKSVQFYAAGEADPSSTVRIEQGINVISAPAVQKFRLGPESFYQAVYSLSGNAVPSPGKTLKATVLLDGKRYDSNSVAVPPLPADEWAGRAREAAVSLQLGQFDSVLKAADGMIALHPERHHGYWYRGLALEAAGNFDGALAAMRQALEKYPRSTKEQYQEPPDKIYLKIRQLRLRSR